MKSFYCCILLTCLGTFAKAQQTDSLPFTLSYSFQHAPGMSGAIVTEPIPVHKGDQFSLELHILPQQVKKRSLLSKILKGAGTAMAVYQGDRLANSSVAGKPGNSKAAENSLLPLGAGMVISADKIAPRRTAVPMLRYEIKDGAGNTAMQVTLPVTEKKSESYLVQDRSPVTGYLQVQWLQGNGGDVIVNIMPGVQAAEMEITERQGQPAEPVLTMPQIQTQTQPAAPDLLPGTCHTALPAKPGNVITKQLTPEQATESVQATQPIRAAGKLNPGGSVTQTMQKSLPASPVSGGNNWPFVPLLGRLFTKQGMLPEDPEEETPETEPSLIKGNDMAEPPPPGDDDDDGYYYDDGMGYCWETIAGDDDDIIVVPCNDNSGIPGNEFEDIVTTTTSDTGLVHLLVRDGSGAIIGDFYLLPGETGYLADGSGYTIDENGNVKQSSPTQSEVTVYASEHYDGSGGNVWGYYGSSSDAQQAATPQPGGQPPTSLPIKFTRSGPCFGSGGSTIGSSPVPPTIPAYNISGLTNPAVGIYNTKIEVDNDGTPNFTGYDPKYQATTAYLTGPSTYLDASSIAYVVFNQQDINSMKLSPDLKLGDIVMLVNNATGQYIFAIYGDHGNTGEAGEISYYAASQLGLPGVSQQSGGSGTINIIAFPGSGMGNGQPITQSQINSKGATLLANNPALPYKQLPTGVSGRC